MIYDIRYMIYNIYNVIIYMIYDILASGAIAIPAFPSAYMYACLPIFLFVCLCRTPLSGGWGEGGMYTVCNIVIGSCCLMGTD